MRRSQGFIIKLEIFMKLEQHVLKAIDDFEQNHLDSSLMNACFAIEGTARNIYGADKVGKKVYKDCIRRYAWILEPMLGGGLDTMGSLLNNLRIDSDNGEYINNPDIADVIYHLFRCHNAHGKEVPLNYELLSVKDGESRWLIGPDILKMPNRIIWALLAISVFAKANSAIKTDGDYCLTWGSETLGLGIEKFTIKDWWGREEDFKTFLAKKNPKPIKVKLDGLDKLRVGSSKL